MNDFNNQEAEKEIIRIIDKIRPYLYSEGGDIEYVGFKDGVVYVRMLGACNGCMSMDYTLKDGIEALLVENVPEVIEVKNLEPGEGMEI